MERFHTGKVKALYQWFEEKGRLLPAGLHYIIAGSMNQSVFATR